MGSRDLKSAHPAGTPRFDWTMLRPKHWGTWCIVAVVLILSVLPRRLALKLGDYVGSQFYRRNAKRREVARINVAMCFPQMPERDRERLVEEHFKLYGKAIVDLGFCWWGARRNIQRWITFRGLDDCLKMTEGGQNVILFTPHVVSLDFGGIGISLHKSGVSMMKRPPDPLLSWLMWRGRSRFGGRILMRDQGLRPFVRGVREGRIGYFMPDEDFGPDQSVFAPFFGIPTATLPVLGTLAKLSNAVAVPAFTRLLDSGHYEVIIGEPLQSFPTGDDVEDATRMNAALESLIRSSPGQYMWTLKWFKTRPGNAPAPYAS